MTSCRGAQQCAEAAEAAQCAGAAAAPMAAGTVGARRMPGESCVDRHSIFCVYDTLVVGVCLQRRQEREHGLCKSRPTRLVGRLFS
mmetsp:Transcript_16243/g.48377  ORF Transcript_16243/g.48377 Transcript_16243/m.48377 type:complete len:86 (+) Transcript_16243:279-536(+)